MKSPVDFTLNLNGLASICMAPELVPLLMERPAALVFRAANRAFVTSYDAPVHYGFARTSEIAHPIGVA